MSKRLGSAGAATLSEKTGTHNARTDSDDADRDEQAACIVAITIWPSSTVIVAWSAT
jgi:hypothetical protein